MMITRAKSKGSGDPNFNLTLSGKMADVKKHSKFARKLMHDKSSRVVQMKNSLGKASKPNSLVRKKEQSIHRKPQILGKILHVEMLAANNESVPKIYEPYQPRDKSFWMVNECKQWTVLDQIIKQRNARKGNKDKSDFQLKFDSTKLTETEKVSICRNWTSLHNLICSRHNKAEVTNSPNFFRLNDDLRTTNLISSVGNNENLPRSSTADPHKTQNNNSGYMTQQNDLQGHIQETLVTAAPNGVRERVQKQYKEEDTLLLLQRLRCNVMIRIDNERHRNKCLKSLRMFEKVYFKDRPSKTNSVLTSPKASQICNALNLEDMKFDYVLK